MSRWMIVGAGILALGGCGDAPLPTFPVDEDDLAPPESILAYGPALTDVEGRILSTGGDPAVMDRLGTELQELQDALVDREVQRAARALDGARTTLRGCDDDCLIGPERSVIEITLDHAARLLGLELSGG